MDANSPGSVSVTAMQGINRPQACLPHGLRSYRHQPDMYQQRRAVQATFFGIPVLCLLNKQTPRVLDLLELLLHAELVAVTALLLPAVDGADGKTSVAPASREGERGREGERERERRDRGSESEVHTRIVSNRTPSNYTRSQTNASQTLVPQRHSVFNSHSTRTLTAPCPVSPSTTCGMPLSDTITSLLASPRAPPTANP